MRKRTLLDALAATSVASLALASSLRAQDVEPVNYLPNPYETVRDWGELPDGRQWGSVPAVDMDPDGVSLWVLDRCGVHSWQSSGIDSCVGQTLPPILKLDTRTGRVLQSFGSAMFVFPHAMHVDPDANIWVADLRPPYAQELAAFPSWAGKGSQVFKFSPDGRLLMTIGTAGEAGDPPERLNLPMDVAVAPNGDIFVAEGDHGGTQVARISKFSSDGTFIESFGRPGPGPGELAIPHGMTFGPDGRLYVADRGNHRVEIFDQDGNYLDEYRKFGRPSDVFIDRNGLLYAIDSESGRQANPGWRKGVRIGRASDGEVLYFIPPHFIEDTFLFPSGVTIYSEGAAGDGVAVDRDGNVYAGEVGTRNPIVGITKYIRRFELAR